VIIYAKEHRNRAAERHFALSANEDMVSDWKEVQDLEKN
jgi:hypothetical protein